MLVCLDDALASNLALQQDTLHHYNHASAAPEFVLALQGIIQMGTSGQRFVLEEQIPNYSDYRSEFHLLNLLTQIDNIPNVLVMYHILLVYISIILGLVYSPLDPQLVQLTLLSSNDTIISLLYFIIA